MQCWLRNSIPFRGLLFETLSIVIFTIYVITYSQGNKLIRWLHISVTKPIINDSNKEAFKDILEILKCLLQNFSKTSG